MFRRRTSKGEHAKWTQAGKRRGKKKTFQCSGVAWQGKGKRTKERERMHEKWAKTRDWRSEHEFWSLVQKNYIVLMPFFFFFFSCYIWEPWITKINRLVKKLVQTAARLDPCMAHPARATKASVNEWFAKCSVNLWARVQRESGARTTRRPCVKSCLAGTSTLSCIKKN